jgi:hypothetical protein
VADMMRAFEFGRLDERDGSMSEALRNLELMASARIVEYARNSGPKIVAEVVYGLPKVLCTKRSTVPVTNRRGGSASLLLVG